MHCPRAPTLEPSKGLRPQNRYSQKRKVKRSWCPVSCLSWLARLGFLSRARVSGSFFPIPACFCLFFFLLLFLSIGRGRHVPAPGWEGRRVKRTGADPSARDCLAYLVAPVLFFVFLFATLFLRITTGVTMGIAKHSGYSCLGIFHASVIQECCSCSDSAKRQSARLSFATASSARFKFWYFTSRGNMQLVDVRGFPRR